MFSIIKMECEFCKKIFTGKNNLRIHQTKAKYCLKIQEKSAEITYTCSYCSKIFNRKDSYDVHLTGHLTDPFVIKMKETKTKMEDELKELRMKLEQKDEELRIKLEQKDEVLKNALEQIRIFQEQNQKLLMKAVSTPKNTYNTVNIEHFTPITQQHLDDNVKNLTLEHINKGPRGYAEYMINYPCKNSLVVTDIARMIFKYKDDDGNLYIDIEARNLINKISKSIDPHNRELITKAIADINSNKRIDVLEQLKRIAELAEYSNSVGFMDGMSSDFAKKLCKELVNLAPKKNNIHSISSDNRDSLIKSDDIEYIMSYSDSDSEITC
jgi:uncharacterized C2H2 Zn-finger protein